MRCRLFFAIIFGLLAASPAAAAVRLRAIYPNPPGSDEGEWVAIENTAAASVSAGLYSIRDSAGSVKTFALGSMAADEIRLFTASQSGLTLNNAGESVELLAEGIMSERSPFYVASVEGQVWLQLDTGWREVTLSEYLDRSAARDWGEVAVTAEVEETNEPSPTASPLAVASPSPIAAKPTLLPPAAPPEFKMPRLKTIPVATPAPIGNWPVPPEPDYQAEIESFLSWKRQALFGSLALLFAGGCWLLLAVPSLRPLWRWLRDELML